jgi:hypothetical protein
VRPIVLLLLICAPAAADVSAPAALPAPNGSASTPAATSDGKLLIAGSDDGAIHEHGGDAAHLSHARFKIVNHGPSPRVIEAESVDFLVGQQCELPSQLAAQRVPTAATAKVQIAPTATKEIAVDFNPPVDA